MTHEPSPAEEAAARLIADPDFVRRRLNTDLEAVAALQRGSVHVNPQDDLETLVTQLREAADRLGFESPTEAATLSKQRFAELPVAERDQETKVEAYHDAASKTLRSGTVVTDRAEADGTRFMEFQRSTPETDLMSVTLSAQVRLQAEGTAWFDDFGWPSKPVRPVHTFTGTTEDFLAQALTDLRQESIPLARGLLLLFGATLKNSGSPGLDEQRLQIAETVVTRRRELNAYFDQAENYALASGTRGWYAACLYRSVLENLFEGYLGGVTFSLFDAEEIDDLDDELRERLPGSTGAEPSAVPAGVPSHHWWWETAFGV